MPHKYLNIAQIYILLISISTCILCIPKTGFIHLDSETRPIVLSACLALFFLLELFKKKTQSNIYSIDFWWLALIAYSFLSFIWSTNGYYAIYGGFSTLVIYAAYKAFETIDFEQERERKLFYRLFLICLFLAISICSYSVSGIILDGLNLNKLDQKTVLLFDKNLHLLGSLILMLFPFVLISDLNKRKYLSFALLAITMIAIYLTGSAQVTILMILLIVLYILYHLRYKQTQKYIAVLGFLVLVMFSLFKSFQTDKNAVNTSFVVKEFTQQNDRFLMWKNSWKLFSQSPLIGQGKNNWVTTYGQFGYNKYNHFKGSVSSTNRYTHPHNSVFSILSEQGVLGIIMYCYIGLIPLLRLCNERKLLSNKEVASVIVLVFFFLLGLIYGIVYNFYGNFRGLTILAIFALAVISRKSNKSTFIVQTQSKLLPAFMLGTCILCFSYFYEFSVSKQKINLSGKELKAQRTDSALDLYKRANLFLKDPITLSQGSSIFQEREELEKAFKANRQSRQLDPYNIEYLYQLSVLQYNLKKYEQSIKTCTTSLKLNGNHMPSLILSAKAKYKLEPTSVTKEEVTRIYKLLLHRKKLYSKYSNRKGKRNIRNEIKYKQTQNLIKDLQQFMKKNNIQ